MAKGDVFLKMQADKAGAIVGEAKDATHGGEIDVLGWSWAMDYPTDLRSGGRTGRATMRGLSITKGCDSASTALMTVLWTNDRVKTAVLSVRKSGGGAIDYLVVTLKDAYIASWEIVHTETQPPLPMEKFELRFKEIEVRYAPQDGTGSKTGSSTFQAQVTTA